MAEKECVFKIELNEDYTCRVELGAYERLATLNKLKELIEIQTKMAAWLNNTSVSEDDKDLFMPMFLNLLQSISYTWDLLRRAGATDKELKEHTDLPF